MSPSLRFLTCLSPGLPLELFERVARHVSSVTGMDVELTSEEATSGPPPGEPDPFSTGRADLGFVCAPSLLWLMEQTPAPVELLAAAMVPLDPRAGGRPPVYFSDVIVQRDSPVRSFAGLRSGVWAYNDSCSLSGWYNLLRTLVALGEDGTFFRHIEHAGSHLGSIRRVAEGSADAAAIDSNVLALALARDPGLARRVRVLESWGPHPIQPVVVRASLPSALKRTLTTALLTMRDPRLAACGISGFASVGAADYESERRALLACERLQRTAQGGGR